MTKPTFDQERDPAPTIDAELVRLVQRAVPNAQIVGASRLGPDDATQADQVTAKAAGYGIPLLVDILENGQRRKLVLHGTTANQFGHDRRADRAAELLLAADTYGSIPRHARALDVGTFRADGTSVSLLDSGEFYLLTDYVQGHPYADDLRRIAAAKTVGVRDVERVHVMADYLAALHTPQPEQAGAYARSLRDLLGAGEGIFGIVDGYPPATSHADRIRLHALEHRCLDWRWRLKQRKPRPTRIHGDFHPFNVLFDEPDAFHVLDASRGALGDAADDVTCMAVNFIFFALEDAAAWHAALAPLWRAFWQRYLSRTRDEELLAVAAPFLAWRLLVLACPVWYPNLSGEARGRLLGLAESALERDCFDPELAEGVFR